MLDIIWWVRLRMDHDPVLGTIFVMQHARTRSSRQPRMVEVDHENYQAVRGVRA